MNEQRSLSQIAQEIEADWTRITPYAKPYLLAMLEKGHYVTRDNIKERNYHQDSMTSVVLYFLSNAATWRGETARRIKAELKSWCQ